MSKDLYKHPGLFNLAQPNLYKFSIACRYSGLHHVRADL